MEIENLGNAGQDPVVEDPQNPESGQTDAGEERVVDAQQDGEGAGDAGEGESARQEGPKDAPAATGNAGQAARQLVQSRRDNAAAKAARLQAERETAARVKAEYDREIAAAGIADPATGRRLETLEDFRAYTAQLREDRLAAEAKRTGRPLDVLREEDENRRFLSEMRRKSADRNGAPSEASASLGRGEGNGMERIFGDSRMQRNAVSFDLAADAAAFAESYPQVDPVKLERDKRFRRFAGSRLYKEPLAELYADYLEVTAGAAEAGRAKADSKAQRSTGSGAGGGEVKLSSAQLAELEAWNKANPSMRMTAKEFAGR